jgi:hypothetical protein
MDLLTYHNQLQLQGFVFDATKTLIFHIGLLGGKVVARRGICLKNSQLTEVTPRSHLITEFNYLKISALILLIFVHSDLIFTYPSIIYPIQWFLLSAFFFVSGFLAYDSFHNRDNNLKRFFKSKARHLYLPFMIATIFYFVFQNILASKTFDLVKLGYQLSMLNVFDRLNSIYNWASLWFIPYLLAFMLIICLIEKYLKNVKIQILAVSVVWLSTITLWVFDSPFRLGQLFSQFLLVFMFGFFLNKLKVYDRFMSFKMAAIVISLVIFFSFDFSGFFTYTNITNAFQAQLYFNIRSIVLTLGLVLLTLLFLRKIRVPKNGFGKKIATKSAFIYLSEPFISFLILTYVFGASDGLVFDGGIGFIVYQTVRVVVLLLGVPFLFMAWEKYGKTRAAFPQAASASIAKAI